MPEGTLYIGTRRYSSWSMRGWLMVKLARLDVEEEVIPLAGGSTEAAKRISPSGLVPFLRHGEAMVWETLAIAEYCAEIEPGLWPEEPGARAWARSIAAEMHAGFRELRGAMPMNLGAHKPGVGATEGALADIARIEMIWEDTRRLFGSDGPYLFGPRFTAADAMYAPVVSRFLTYEPPLAPVSLAYCRDVRSHPLVAEWYAAAMAEPKEWLLDKYESIA